MSPDEEEVEIVAVTVVGDGVPKPGTWFLGHEGGLFVAIPGWPSSDVQLAV